jgi:hypothetical protein
MFQLKTEDRLRSWRGFRYSIGALPLELALQQTVELWSHCPFIPYHLDSKDPTSWPNPWQLLDDNIYCDLAKSLGIVYTMLLTEHRKNLEIEIRVYKDPETGYEYNLSWFNQGKYIANLINAEIVNIEQFDKALRLEQIYTTYELQLHNY